MTDKDEAIDLLVLKLAKTGMPLDDLKRELFMALSEFDVTRKEQEIIPYTGGKTEYLLKKYIIAKGISGLSKQTLDTYYKTLSRIFRGIGKEYDQITSDDVQIMIGKTLACGNKKGYANDKRVVLNGFYNWLIREEIYTKNPVSKVDKIKYIKPRKKAMNEIEIEKIRDACITFRERAIVEMLLSTGCRASELAEMTIEDVKGNEVQIIGKGGKPRTVYINAKARIAVDRYLKERTDETQWLFPASIMAYGKNISALRPSSPKNGEGADWYTNKALVADCHIDKEYLNNTVKKIAKRAGVEGVHTHRFRRTCATMALRHGMPIELVSMMLGHSNIQTTQIYLDINESELKQAHEKYINV